MTDAWYVDIAAVRIQSWLARSAAIRYRRGASYRLAELTSPQAVTKVLTEHHISNIEWNEEAGEVSGVASLRFTDSENETAASAKALAATMAIAGCIRTDFPALPLRASWGRGSSYVEAYAADMARRIAVEGPLLDLPALAEEGFLARPCDMCRVARAIVAEHRVIHAAAPQALCRDCLSRVSATAAEGFDRWNAAAGYTSRAARLPVPQRRVMNSAQEELAGAASGSGQISFPADFSALAQAMGRAGDARTQVATIFADGNRIGSLIDQWIHQSHSGSHGVTKATIAQSITDATRAAVVQALIEAKAVAARGQDQAGTLLPGIVHIADGDDILLTVPAGAAWPTCRALAYSFAEGIRARLGAEFEQVSLSMGMVFHHNTHPIADVVEKAEHLLTQAKRDVGGAEASVAFLDLTADGQDSRGLMELKDASGRDLPRESIRLSTLADPELSACLDAAADIEASSRSTITQLLREAVLEGQVPSSPKVESAQAALVRRLTRVDDPRMNALIPWRSLTGEPPSGSDLENLLLGSDPQYRNDLRLRLDISRWWSPASGQMTSIVREAS